MYLTDFLCNKSLKKKKVAYVILVTFVTFVTKLTVVNRKVGTYVTRGNKCKHWTRKISNFGKKKDCGSNGGN